MKRSDKQRAIVDRIAVTATCGATIVILGICSAVANPRGDPASTRACAPGTTLNAHVSESDALASPNVSAACAKTATLPRS